MHEDPQAQVARGQELADAGRLHEAESCFRAALALDPQLRSARRSLATLLVRLDRRGESLPLWREEVLAGDAGLAWLQGLITHEMMRGELALAGEYAAVHAELRWGSAWYPARADALPLPVHPPPATLTVPKLVHDLEQLEYLLGRGALGDELVPMLGEYRRAIDRLAERGPDARAPLDAEDQRAIGHVYGRLVHVRPTPRLPRALSGAWDPAAIERRYLEASPGIVVVDDFLSAEALESLRAFCLESTIWSTNRYAHGRLGAFFEAGFNCPLLIQIAEETRRALPRVLGDRYPLRQLWAFKYADVLPADSSIHADFAAVSVNLWITPDRANLDERTGGLIVYDIDAPPHWTFERYQNTDWSELAPFLSSRNAHAVTIPYRQNRAIIFNSDLFHGTAPLRFRTGYEHRRVNVTMLYGDRADDVHHPRLASRDPTGADPAAAPAWRSAAWARARRSRG